LNHPAIPSAFEYCDADGMPYYTREYFEGKTLEHLCFTGQISLSAGVRILRDVANTVVTVHAHGIVHRNLHPANILVDAAGNFKLIGFGKAGLVDAPPPWNISLELDVQGLMSLLSWLCDNVRNPIMDSHQAVQDPGFATSASEFAHALSTWLQETKGP
jgi:serine/threonine protein kinase